MERNRMDSNIPNSAKIAILKNKIQSYEAQKYSLIVDRKVADLVEDTQKREQIDKQIAMVIKAIDAVTEMLEEIPGETEQAQ
jgi:hypothetical protein